jgi:hypothetical protein
MSQVEEKRGNSKLTGNLLGFVAFNGAYNRILVAPNAIRQTLSVPLRLGGIVLCLSESMLLLPGLLPRRRAGHIADLKKIVRTESRVKMES